MAKNNSISVIQSATPSSCLLRRKRYHSSPLPKRDEKEKIVEVSTHHLVLAPDAAIDLQLHTTFSDGTWTPEQLLDYLAHEQFRLAAITDHDRVDTAPVLQQLAAEKHLHRRTAEEMST